jgi:DNA-binding SARP family transcriptional activator
MKACQALNDRAGAIRLYQKLERSLQEDLGIAPQEVVQAYFRGIFSP